MIPPEMVSEVSSWGHLKEIPEDADRSNLFSDVVNELSCAPAPGADAPQPRKFAYALAVCANSMVSDGFAYGVFINEHAALAEVTQAARQLNLAEVSHFLQRVGGIIPPKVLAEPDQDRREQWLDEHDEADEALSALEDDEQGLRAHSELMLAAVNLVISHPNLFQDLP